MRNYYETLAYADREDLLVEKTRMNIYIGFKDGENSKTLFEIPEDKSTIESMLSELKDTKYKESNLYKLLAKTMVENKINNLDENSDIDTEIISLVRFLDLTGYKLTEEDYRDLEKNANIIYFEKEKCFCHKSYYEKKKLLDEIIKDKMIYITNENLKEVKLVLPGQNYIVEEIDDDIMNETSYYHYYHYSDTKLYDSEYYCDLYDDMTTLLNMLKNKEINVVFENQEIKDEISMKVFWILSTAAELLSNYSNDSDFTEEYLNYYNSFYDGKVLS